MGKYWFILVFFLLGGCANRLELVPRVPLEARKLCYRVEVVQGFGLPRESLIVAAVDKKGHWRWQWNNLLGMPLARQRLDDGHWQDDGFLPLYPQARPLFAALLYLETPPRKRAMRYPQAFEVHESGKTSVYLRRARPGAARRAEQLFSLQRGGAPTILLTLAPSRERFRIEKLSDD